VKKISSYAACTLAIGKVLHIKETPARHMLTFQCLVEWITSNKDEIIFSKDVLETEG
jgi:hypothetical protein